MKRPKEREVRKNVTTIPVYALRSPGSDEEDADPKVLKNVPPTEAATAGKTKGEAADGPCLQLLCLRVRLPEKVMYVWMLNFMFDQ